MATTSSATSPMEVEYLPIMEIHDEVLELSFDFRRAVTSTPLVQGTPLRAFTLQGGDVTSSTVECMSISFADDSAMSGGDAIAPVRPTFCSSMLARSFAALTTSSQAGGPKAMSFSEDQLDETADADKTEVFVTPCSHRGGTPVKKRGDRDQHESPMKPHRKKRLLNFVQQPFVMRRLFGAIVAEPGDV